MTSPSLSHLAPVADFPRSTIHQAFEFWAQSTPDAEAAVCAEVRLTYAELNKAANQLAHFLIEQGIRPESPVGICTERSIDMIVGQLGILKAGGFYAPVDANFPAPRIAFILHDTEPNLVLTQQHLQSFLPKDSTIAVHCLDSARTPWHDYPTHNPNEPHSPDQLAYIIYTSGSTGNPKGVAIPHRGVVRLVKAQDYVPFDPAQRYLLLASPSFDAIIFELWGPLLNGCCCVVFPDRLPEAHRMAELIRNEQISCCFLTTQLFNQIIDHHPATLAPLQKLLVGGSALSVEHIRRAQEKLPHIELINGYGPTECTTFACAYSIGPSASWPCESVPLGPPLNNTECLIVNENLQAVPITEAGEILLGGPGLAREYWRRPELTAERFIAHPLPGHTGERLYRTGDRGRILPTGDIEYLGRLDHQIKIRGFRIEPGEIEHSIRQYPGVQDVAVFTRPISSGHQLVASIVWANPSSDSTASDLQEWMRGHLPDYMVPGLVQFVPQLPLTLNGKVDRSLLSVSLPSTQDPDPETNISASDSLEATFIFLWRKVLQIGNVSALTDFHQHGGDSLARMELALKIGQVVGHPISVSWIHRAPTPRAMAALCDQTASLASASTGAVSRNILFQMPGVGGGDEAESRIALALPPGWESCDTLDFPARRAARPRRQTFEALAADMVSAVQQVQPHGPYHFSGLSFGSLIAFEVARQLAASGEKIGKLILWDPGLFHEWRPASRAGVWAEARNAFRSKIRAFRQSRDWAKLFTLTPLTKAQLRRPWNWLRPGRRRIEMICLNKKWHQRFQRNALLAFENYHPQPFPGDVVILRCQRRIHASLPIEMWRTLVGGNMTIHNLECGHAQTVREPFVSELVALTCQELANYSPPPHRPTPTT